MEPVELRAQLEKYHCEGFGWALSCCNHNRAEAEDVLQAVYLKALEGKARFDGRAAFKTWLFAVIRKTAIDGRRRRMPRGFLLLQHESRVLPVTSVETDQVDETQALAQLDKVLALEREIKHTHIGLLVRVKNKFTPEQQARLREIASKSRE
jgi:RNA polymerase sigma factor (sigma-70 family)